MYWSSCVIKNKSHLYPFSCHDDIDFFQNKFGGYFSSISDSPYYFIDKEKSIDKCGGVWWGKYIIRVPIVFTACM